MHLVYDLLSDLVWKENYSDYTTIFESDTLLRPKIIFKRAQGFKLNPTKYHLSINSKIPQLKFELEVC